MGILTAEATKKEGFKDYDFKLKGSDCGKRKRVLMTGFQIEDSKF